MNQVEKKTTDAVRTCRITKQIIKLLWGDFTTLLSSIEYIYRGIHICISISGFEYSYICRSNWTSKLFLIQLRPQAWMTEYLFYTIYNEHRFISEGYQMSIKAAAEKLCHFIERDSPDVFLISLNWSQIIEWSAKEPAEY